MYTNPPKVNSQSGIRSSIGQTELPTSATRVLDRSERPHYQSQALTHVSDQPHRTSSELAILEDCHCATTNGSHH